jgi:flagellin-like protein
MGKMKANRKFIEADDRAVSAVIGVILMVAITVAIAATVYVYVSGMIGGTKNATPSIAITVDSANHKLVVASADLNLKWSDIVITPASPATAALTNSTMYITAGDSITITQHAATSPVSVSLMYKPTNSLLGTWYINF